MTEYLVKQLDEIAEILTGIFWLCVVAAVHLVMLFIANKERSKRHQTEELMPARIKKGDTTRHE